MFAESLVHSIVRGYTWNVRTRPRKKKSCKYTTVASIFSKITPVYGAVVQTSFDVLYVLVTLESASNDLTLKEVTPKVIPVLISTTEKYG